MPETEEDQPPPREDPTEDIPASSVGGVTEDLPSLSVGGVTEDLSSQSMGATSGESAVPMGATSGESAVPTSNNEKEIFIIEEVLQLPEHNGAC